MQVETIFESNNETVCVSEVKLKWVCVRGLFWVVGRFTYINSWVEILFHN